MAGIRASIVGSGGASSTQLYGITDAGDLVQAKRRSPPGCPAPFQIRLPIGLTGHVHLKFAEHDGILFFVDQAELRGGRCGV